jgi:protein tyrosine phosphatase
LPLFRSLLRRFPNSHFFPLLSLAERRLSELRVEIDTLSSDNNAGFTKVFGDIGTHQLKPSTASELHRHLNRYNNIFAYDDTRVKITPRKANFNSDYINANWVPGERIPRQYIATQGPVPDSFDSFWQMVWECGSTTIVMVTNEVEGGKLKCHRYWPVSDEQSDGSIALGDENSPLLITAQGENVHPTYVERKFTLSQKGEKRQVVQLAYTAWPDHGVPTTTKEILQFRSEIMRFNPRGPLVIHCSAGVGRTGTMIGIDRFIEATFNLKTLAVPDIVCEMREARNFMVQGQFQFMYIYAACMDALQRMLNAVVRVRM